MISLSPAGEELWSVPLPGAGPLIVGHDGEIVVAVDGRTLYVIRDAVGATPPPSR